MKSSNTFCFLSKIPCLCQLSPYSLQEVSECDMHERERTCLINVSVHPPSSSQIGHCEHSPKILHKDDSAGAEVGSDGDIEASIAIEKSGVDPIQRDTLQQKKKQLHGCDAISQYRPYLSMDYEHWDLGSIFAGIEHLIGLE